MPESVTDRPTAAHEKVFLLTKSGTALLWTHRDGLEGVRSLPEPDYFWENRQTKEETDSEPEGWRELVDEDDKRIWARINKWVGRDYFYDAEAVRVFSGNGWHGKTKPSLAPEDAERQSETARTETAGANLRNVWSIDRDARRWNSRRLPDTSPRLFRHLPAALVEPCIKAGTSERGVCGECGAPWVRVVERAEPIGSRQPRE